MPHAFPPAADRLHGEGCGVVIHANAHPPGVAREIERVYDKIMYRWRHLVENYFAKIKEFRGIATRYDKTDTSYAANLTLVAAIIAAR